MVVVEHLKAADIICQPFTDKIPDETTIHCMAYACFVGTDDYRKRTFHHFVREQLLQGDQAKNSVSLGTKYSTVIVSCVIGNKTSRSVSVAIEIHRETLLQYIVLPVLQR